MKPDRLPLTARGSSNRKIGAAASLFAAGLAGCASPPPATVAQISAADAVVTQAEPLAARYAPQMLHEAQSKLARAEAAMRNRAYDEARRLAEEAEADARLALASAERQRSQQAVAELKQGLQVLKQELERRTQ